MRGKVVVACGFAAGDGITPAHAGKRTGQHSRFLQGGDHPRPCGEKPMKRGQGEGAKGSPPPMRGKVLCRGQRANFPRITPAHAGKSIMRIKYQM